MGGLPRRGGADINTYNDIYLDARRRLRAAEIASYDLESRLLACKASGKAIEAFLRDSRNFDTDGSFGRAVGEMVTRRLGGEPIAYIIGEWQFYGLPISVTPSVLIPRVDTEVLAKRAIELLRGRGAVRVLDLCAGSGCVGLAIAANTPSARVVLADYSRKALSVCRANILRNSLSRTVSATQLDALESPPALGSFDLLVSNPPYIPSAEIAGLDEAVRRYEPREALDGGADGLSFYRSIAGKWKQTIKPGGALAFEAGAGQADDVRAILAAAGFQDIRTYRDTLEIERVVIGTA